MTELYSESAEPGTGVAEDGRPDGLADESPDRLGEPPVVGEKAPWNCLCFPCL